jgi:hypothetical protein
MVSSHTADSKPVGQEVNSTVILPPLVFPGIAQGSHDKYRINANFKATLKNILNKMKMPWSLIDTGGTKI